MNKYTIEATVLDAEPVKIQVECEKKELDKFLTLMSLGVYPTAVRVNIMEGWFK